MMAAIISGSARKGGNTDVLSGTASHVLEEKGYDVTVFRPYDMSISHCTNCGGCDDSGVCVIDDDMTAIYKAVEKSDVILFSTPIHFSGMSSITKQVVDRLQCMWHRQPSEHRRMMGAIISGGSADPIFKNAVSVFKAVANTLGAEWSGEYTVRATDDGMTGLELSGLKEYVRNITDRLG